MEPNPGMTSPPSGRSSQAQTFPGPFSHPSLPSPTNSSPNSPISLKPDIGTAVALSLACRRLHVLHGPLSHREHRLLTQHGNLHLRDCLRAAIPYANARIRGYLDHLHATRSPGWCFVRYIYRSPGCFEGWGSREMGRTSHPGKFVTHGIPAPEEQELFDVLVRLRRTHMGVHFILVKVPVCAHCGGSERCWPGYQRVGGDEGGGGDGRSEGGWHDGHDADHEDEVDVASDGVDGLVRLIADSIVGLQWRMNTGGGRRRGGRPRGSVLKVEEM